jgi:hypothetical protein
MATDAEIRAAGLYAVPEQRFLQNEFQLPTNEVIEEETESFGIPNTNAFTNSGGGGGENNFFNSPYTAQTGYKTNRVSDYSGYLPGTRPEPSKFQPAMDLIGKGIGMAIPGGNFLMGMAKNQSRENRLNATDNAFIDMQLANQEQGPSGNLTNQDRYGYNKVSAFGNYADLVSKKAAAGLAKPEDERTKFDNYFIQKGEEEEDIKNQIAANNAIRQKAIAEKIRNAKPTGIFDPKFNIHNDAGDNTPPPPPNKKTNDDGGGGFDKDPGPDPTGSKERGFNMYGDGKMAKGGRVGYFFGGRVNYKAGGRTNYVRGGAAQDMGNAENQKASATAGGGATGDFSTGEQTMNHNIAIRNATKKTTPVKDIIDKGSELNYLNNLKNLNLPGIVLGLGVNKFRNYLDNKKTKEEDDKLSYNNTLPTNNYFTEVQQKDLDASKMKGFKQQDYPSYKDQMDMLNGGTKVTPYEFKGLQDGTITTTGTFTAANGGRVSFKNGGLASIL